MHRNRSSLVCLLLCTVFCVDFSVSQYTPPIIAVDLDGPPEQRWLGALDHVMQNWEWEYSFGALFKHINDTVVNSLPAHVFSDVGDALRTFWPTQYRELQGLVHGFAQYGHPEITYEYLAVWAYYHSLGHANFGGGSGFSRNPQRECTGVLVSSAGGVVTHGRNMDNEPEQLRNLTIHFKLRIGGHVVAEAMDWYWSGAGFMTVFVPGVVSMEENWRKLYHDYDGSIILNAITRGAMSQNWFFREALFTLQLRKFEDLVNFTATVKTAGPLYAIIAGAGPHQGAVITRDPVATYPMLLLSNQTGSDGWFLVETNYDHWLPDSNDDDRRTVAENALRQLGQAGATIEGVLGVMTTAPVLNADTVFTAVMRPSTGEVLWLGQGGQ